MDFKDKWAGEMTKVLKIPSSEAKQASGLVYFSFLYSQNASEASKVFSVKNETFSEVNSVSR